MGRPDVERLSETGEAIEVWLVLEVSTDNLVEPGQFGWFPAFESEAAARASFPLAELLCLPVGEITSPVLVTSNTASEK